MKKIISFIIVVFAFILIISCKNGGKGSGYEIALITEGSIDDKSFNPGSLGRFDAVC